MTEETANVFKQASPLDDIGDVGEPIGQDTRKAFGPAAGPSVMNTVADSFAPQGGGTGASAIGTALQETGPARFTTPLDDLGDLAASDVSATGAAARGAVRGALPAAGSLAAAGAGAEVGGAAGSLIGPWGTVAGGLIGGLGGAIAGGAAVDKAQSWMLSKLPDSFVDAFGQGDRQQRLDQQERPIASFVGGMVPFALTMQPTKLLTGATALPESATALQRLMANPVTARLFGGGVMGGMELGTEAIHGEVDWRKVGIATGFGVVFNKPNRLGEVITEMGASPSRRILGRPSPTIAQAGDTKVMGPGITEAVFQGTHEQAPEAAMTAQESARAEHAALGEHEEPNPADIARSMEPALFARYDELQARAKSFGAQTGPGGEEIAALDSHLAATRAELDKMEPEIAAAYRRAADTMNIDTVEPPQFKSFADMIAAHERGPNAQAPSVPSLPAEGAAAENAGVPGVSGVPAGGEAGSAVAGPDGAAGAGAPGAQRAIGAQRAFIAEDVTRRLIAAGRPEDEARAAGQLVAARYITRAGRFEGKLGSGEELYARDSAAIAGPDGRGIQPAAPPREVTQAAETAAKEKAATPATQPGILASDFEGADRIKNEWRQSTPFTGSVEDFIAASKPNQESLAAAGKEIAATVGIDFKDPGVKATGPGKGMDRLQSKAKRFGTVGSVTDQVRAGFDVKTPAQADQIVQQLGEKFQVTDEGWQMTPAGYFDRKLYIRFPDGMIGEVQMWPPGMLGSKKVGHKLYEGARELPPWHPLIPEFNHAQADVYEPVRAALSAEWNAVLGKGGSEPNRLPNAADESTAELRPTSAALTSSHEPLTSAHASEGVQNAGSPSQEQALMSDIFGVSNKNIGEHSAPVNAALTARDKIDDLSPAEQKTQLPTYTAAAEQAPQGRDQPAGVFMFDPTALDVDAKRFQFKSGGDDYGVTGALRNVQKWDPAKAQSIIVWEQADGKLFVADGHQRSGLARRLVEQGKAKNVQLPGVLYREKDGVTADDIRAIAAVTNIANGSGKAIDGAKVLRERPDLLDDSLPLSAGKGKQAAALARLGDEAFRMVVNDVVPEHYGAVVGDLLPKDPERQVAALKAIARFEPRNADEAAVLTQRVAQAELAKREEGSQTSMFGDLETAESTAGEEMKIVGRAIADLKKDKALFARVLRNAERIEQTGSTIEREAAQNVSNDAEVFAKTLTSEAYASGPVRTVLVAAARDLKNGKASIGEATDRILAALRKQTETNGADRAGAVGAGTKERELAQKDAFDFEAGAEGKPQTLIPGVAPVTARDRIQALADKPLAPKKAQKDIGGLFGSSMDQKELFQIMRGKIRIGSGRPLITLLKDANASTFMHETGHEWLEQMVKDAGHADAPKVVRDDMQIVNDWLGIKPDRAPPPKEGMIRFYHGTAYKDASGFEGKTFVSPHEQYARDYHGGPNNVLYTDLTKEQAIAAGVYDEVNGKPRNGSIEDGASKLRPLESSGSIQTKHHEKFARGFEQYLRQGVAPSKDLAGVFAQFRNWLLSIYQNLRGLGAEINPEIRGVFDRMLETEPQRTVIAPDRLQPNMLHDIHEAEAAHTPPHEAEPAADRIVAETARYIADQPPEIQGEIQAAIVRDAEAQAAVAGSEAGAGAGGAGQVEPGGVGSVAEPGGGAGGAQHGAEQPGGGAAPAESPAGPRPDTRSELGRDPGTALAPGPVDLFGEQSKFTDKAGNIRLDTLNTSEDVKQAIRDSAAENNDFIGDRRGVVTDGQVIELAHDIGMDGAERLVKDHITGQAFNAEQIVALRKLLRETAAGVSIAAKKAAESGVEVDIMAYAQARDRLQMVQKTVAGVTAEAGRALRAFRTLPGEAQTGQLEQMVREATGKTLFQLQQEAKLAAQMDTSAKVNKFMQDMENRSLGGAVLEIWINGLLSGMSTHATNVISNTVFMVQHFGPERLLAGIIGSAARAAGREGPSVHVGELGAIVQGAKEGLAPALQATGTAYRKGASTLLPGEEGTHGGLLEGVMHDDLVPRGTLNEDVTMREVASGAFGAIRGTLDAIMAGGALVKAGGARGAPLWELKYTPGGQVPDIGIHGMTVPVGSLVRAPGRFLATMDTFFRSLNYTMSKSAIAYRTAADEGLTGHAFEARVAEIRNSPTAEVMEQARTEAGSTTFMDRGGDFVRRLNSLVNVEVSGVKPLKFIMPFTNVVSRILDQALIKRTPVGLFSPELRNDLLGKNGGVAQDTAAARMLMGSTLMLGFGSLAAQGFVTGSGPKDPKEAAVWRLTHQPHSVKIGNVYYDIGKLGPMGMLASLAADLHEIAHIASEDDFAKAGGYFMHAIVQNVLDQSVLQGPADLIKAVETPEQYGPQYIKSFLASFVPNVVNNFAKSRDPYIRQTWGVLDEIKNKLPGYRQDLHPKIDLWGQPVPTRDAFGGTGVTAIYMQKVNSDPVNVAMSDLGMKMGPVEKKIRNVDLKPQEYEDYARASGVMTKQNLDRLVMSPSWESLPPGSKQAAITHIIDACRETARGIVMARYPHIPREAAQQKVETLTKGKK